MKYLLLTALLLPACTPAFAQELTSIAHSPGADGVARVNIQCTELGFPIRQARHRSAMDALGNLYLTGCSTNGDFGQALTMKVAPDGSVGWLQRQEGIPWALATDAEGDVYQVLTDELVKSTPDGQPVWSVTHTHTRVLALARQPDGIVLIGVANNQVRLTKYSDAGSVLWNRDVAPFALGEIGQFETTPTGDLLLGLTDTGGVTTVRVNPAGELAWSRLIEMNIPANQAFDSQASVAVAADGAVFTTANRTEAGAITSKLDAAGNVLWSATGAEDSRTISTAATIDGGAVVVGTNAVLEIVTTKFDAAGGQQWIRRFGLDFPRLGEAVAVSTDEVGDIYVSGSVRSGTNRRMAAIKYSLSGGLVWQSAEDLEPFESSSGLGGQYIPGQGMRVWGTDESLNRFLAVTYSTGDGARQWRTSNPEEVGEFSEELRDSVIMSDGRSYLAGWGYEYITLRPRLAAFDSEGSLDWAIDVPDTDGRTGEVPGPMAVDATGRLYLIRRSEGPGSQDPKLELLCLDPDGALVWNNYLEGEADALGVYRLSVGSSGLYLAGVGSTTGIESNVIVQKHALNGSGLLWTRSHSGHPEGEDRIGDLAVDSADNVIVVFNGQPDARPYGLIKYSESGQLLWELLSPDQSNWADAYLAIDSDDSIVVAATSRDPAEGLEFATRRYSSQGALLWSHSYSQSGSPSPSNANIASSMILLDDGSTVVSGEGNLSSHVTIRISAAGALLWETTHQNSTGPSIVSADPQGNLVVAMASTQSSAEERIAIHELDPNGRVIWTKRLTVGDLGGDFVGLLAARKTADGSIRLATGIRREDVHRKAMSLLVINGGALFLDDFEFD